ncbi:hypothetical protein LTR54_007782 [Friedmanniomyces endolithicus]|nr:hypothetical protein LTR54_007782 [Friedmanniomyces endolithicus]
MPTLWALSPRTRQTVLAATTSSGEHLPLEKLKVDITAAGATRIAPAKKRALGTESTITARRRSSDNDDDDDKDATPRQQRHQDRLHCGCGPTTRRHEGV